jgi:uncharacterized Zn finger protein
MSGQITEEMIRALCTPQSFDRGQEYYSGGAVYNPARQGPILTGMCEGSSAPAYRLQVELDEAGVRSAFCTCPYEYGGYCKHIVALLLAYLYEPEEFIERPGISELLADLDRETLVKLLAKTAARDPDLYDWLEIEVQAAKSSPPVESAPAKGKRKTQVSAKTYERRVKNILHSLDSYRMSEAYWMMDGMVGQLQEVVDTADTFLEAGDAQGAILILMILLEEVANSYDQFDDSDGTLGEFLSEIGQPLAEAILSAELSEVERQKLSDDLEPVVSDLSDYGIDGLGVALAALEQGWAQPEKSQDWEEDEEEWDAEDGGEWYGEADLTQARLNVLERQGRIDEYLELCRQAGENLRLALKLLESGRKEEALIIAMNRLASAPEALAVAQKLRALGQVRDALTLGERGLSLAGEKYSLGQWLGPLEEVQGRIEPAIQAYLAAFASVPSLELYQAVIRLAGSRRKDLRTRMMDILKASSHPDTLVDVYLFEENWDAAIDVADQAGYWSYSLIEKVADAVLPQRPEWVIQASIKQAEGLIEKTQSKYYAAAARWLAKAKKAYLETGRQKEWQGYLTNLKTTYARRPALQAALRQL